jgi:hypothetical protein
LLSSTSNPFPIIFAFVPLATHRRLQQGVHFCCIV